MRAARRAAPQRRAGQVAEQAAGLLQAVLRAAPQAPAGTGAHVQRVQEGPAALRRRAPPCREQPAIGCQTLA